MKKNSRQRNWQIKQKKMGKCSTCVGDIFKAGRCKEHYALHLAKKREYYQLGKRKHEH